MSNTRVIAKATRVRGSARKARIPADVVRGMMVNEALPILEFMPKKAAKDVYKVISSAKANAVHNYNLNEDSLKIDRIEVGESMRLRRMKPKSRGMGAIIKKHFCNIRVELVDVTKSEEVVKVEKKADKKSEKQAEEKKSAKKATKKSEPKKKTATKSKK